VPADLGERRRHLLCLDPPGVCQIGESQRLASREGVPGGQDDRDTRLADSGGGYRREFRERVAGRGQSVGQRDIELAARHAERDLCTRSRPDAGLEARHAPA
jgi:hypothetical protein